MQKYQNNLASLKKEAELLKKELGSVGREDPGKKGDWLTTKEDLNIPLADENEVADAVESFGERVALEKQLELKLQLVEGAIERIENGNYGICRICGGEIEEDRLNAEPTADTCKNHLGQ